MKIARRLWKQVRTEEKGDFANLPSKLSNYANQEFSKMSVLLKRVRFGEKVL